jgi:hypothetical protein
MGSEHTRWLDVHLAGEAGFLGTPKPDIETHARCRWAGDGEQPTVLDPDLPER